MKKLRKDLSYFLFQVVDLTAAAIRKWININLFLYQNQGKGKELPKTNTKSSMFLLHDFFHKLREPCTKIFFEAQTNKPNIIFCASHKNIVDLNSNSYDTVRVCNV